MRRSVVAVLLLITHTSPLHPEEAAPMSTVEALYAALREEKCEKAFGMLTAESQLRYQLLTGAISNYCVVAGTAWPLKGRPLKVDVGESQILPVGGAIVTVRVTIEGVPAGSTQEMTHYLVRECGAWKIIDKSGVAATESIGK